MAITLDDIARELGVAKSTVSITLRNHPKAQRFSAQTRERIIQTARRLGYRPNFFATQLAGAAKSSLVMLTMSPLSDQYGANIAEAFEARIAQRQGRVLLNVCHDEAELTSRYSEILGPHGIRGMAVLGAMASRLTDQTISRLISEGVRLVIIGRDIQHPTVGCVRTDNHRGGCLAAEHLFEQGVRRCWAVVPESVTGSGSPIRPRLLFMKRVEGFFDAARQAGLPEPKLIVSQGIWPRDARQAVLEALQQHEPPQGLMSIGDPLAAGAVQAFTQVGLDVPGDVAVVGYDGNVYGQCCNPPLTSVGQPMQDMGQAAADMLMDMLMAEQQDQTPDPVIMNPSLIVRESSQWGRRAPRHPLPTARVED